MMPEQSINFRLSVWKTVVILLVVTSPGLLMARATERMTSTQVWDTVSPFVNKVDVRDRTNWRLVPPNLLMLESDPAAAMSDPSYYGREYSLQGDLVVENEYVTTMFCSKTGKVVSYSKADSKEYRMQFVPLQLKGKAANITHCRILRNTGDEAALGVSFSGKEGGQDLSATFSFSRKEIIEIRPDENMKGISLVSPIEYGVVPSFIGDDLIYDPKEYPSTNRLYIPSENLFLGLLKGGNSMLVMTWPEGKQEMRLILANEEQGGRLIASVDFENDGKSIYLGVLDAPGIWHKEELKSSYLEKDVAINWKRPFPARWVTQLCEDGVKTTFRFRESKQKRIWRAIIGAYVYPVWFNDENAFYHLGKKIPPEGDSVIYFLERKGTPASVSTPVDIMKETLGGQTCYAILDVAARKLRTHHRRGSVGIRRAATCGCTAAMQPLFKAGKEVERKEYIEGAVDDVLYFVTQHVKRINEYQDFAHNMINFLNLTRKAKPDLEPFLNDMETITQQILQEYSRQKKNIKTLEFAHGLAQKTKALTEKKDPKSLSTYLGLGGKWRDMGGAQDYLVGKCHSISRKLFQEAGYRCVNQAQAVKIAEEIRRRCRRCLRNADGYEIWPNY